MENNNSQYIIKYISRFNTIRTDHCGYKPLLSALVVVHYLNGKFLLI